MSDEYQVLKGRYMIEMGKTHFILYWAKPISDMNMAKPIYDVYFEILGSYYRIKRL